MCAFYSPEHVKCVPLKVRVFEDMIKLRILRWGITLDYSGSPKCITSILIMEKWRDILPQKKAMHAQKHDTMLQDLKLDEEVISQGTQRTQLQKLRKAGKQILLQQFDFSPVKMILNF